MPKRLISLFLSIVMLFSLFPSITLRAEAASDNCSLTVCSSYAKPGETVDVNVEISGNPGIVGATLTLSWDGGLKLTSIENGEAFSELNLTKPSRYESGCNFVWYGSDVTEILDGSILKLKFQLPSNATNNDTYGIRLTYVSGDIVDKNLDTVELDVTNGLIRAVTYNPGDVSGDNRINPLDLVKLSQYISDGCTTDPDGYNVSLNASAADVNDDGRTNPLDLVWISRYISDGCTTNPDGYNIKLLPSTPKCSHVMETVAYKAASCEEDGNITYYHCTVCDKYYNSASGSKEITLASTILPKTGHTAVTDPYVPPTYDAVGWTEGSHCGTCNKVLVAQEEIPKLERETFAIRYSFTSGDLYLQKLEKEGKLVNPNPETLEAGKSLVLDDLKAIGYTFDGWYDSNGTKYTQIVNISGNIQLEARWTKQTYTVQFDTTAMDSKVTMDTIRYTVDAGTTLNNPQELPGYIFMGWSNAEGKLIDDIPVGSAGNIKLYGNWTSKRNMTRPASSLGKPIIHIDDEAEQIYFLYEIGTIENIPLYTFKDEAGNDLYFDIAVPGTNVSFSQTKAVSVDETSAKNITQALSNATTQTSGWTLSNEWTKSSSISETHMNELEKEVAENREWATSASGSFNISTDRGGSTTTAVEAGVSSKISSKVSTEASVGFPVDVVDVGAKVSTEVSAEVGAEVSVSESDTKTWNTNKGYEVSRESSMSGSVSQSLAERISNSVSYDVSNAATEGSSKSQSTANTTTDSREYASSFQYSTATMAETKYERSLNNAPIGYYRMVVAGTAHVFAVVNYDIATQSYGVYTYSIMEDAVKPFLDYSSVTSSFNDNENGILPFEVPYYVNNYVDSIVGASDGLIPSPETGNIVQYNGGDEIIIVPQYMPIDRENADPDVVKITGLAPQALGNNETVKAVQLCSNITALPDDAFAGNTNMILVHAPNVTSIGARAFSGCTALKDYTVSTAVTSLGSNAFEGVNKVTINASNAAVAEAALNCGAKNIVLNLGSISDTLPGKTYTIPSSVESITINGGGRTFTDVKLVSNAGTTIIIDANFRNTADTPIEIASENVTLSKVTANAPGITMRLTAENAQVGLYGTNTISSAGSHAAICKNANFFWSGTAEGKLVLDGNLLYSGALSGTEYVSFSKGEAIHIDNDNPVVVTFDPCEGTVSEASRLVYGGTEIGELPDPARDYYTFVGWFTAADGGEQVDAGDMLVADTTLYAHWTENPVSDWVPAADLPEGASVQEQKWTYTETTNTESTNTSLDGYTKTGSYWVKSSNGTQNYSTAFPGGFDKGHSIYTSFAKSALEAYENETAKREVSNNWAGYVYWHWMYDCGGGNGTSGRAIYHKEGTGPDNGFYYKYFGAFTSSNGNYNSDTGYCNSTGTRNYIIPERTSYAECQGATRWFRFDYYTSNYTDYYKMFQYQKVEEKESSTEVIASDTINNVQQWVKYRIK